MSGNNRQPIRNFFILPKVQWHYIIRILAMVNLSSLLMVLGIALATYLRYDPFDDLAGVSPGKFLAESFWDFVLPAFVLADFLSLFIGVWVSLYFSRKISVPLYKVRVWAENLSSGNLSHQMKFRPGDELEELAATCNLVSEKYQGIFSDIKKRLEGATSLDAAQVEELRRDLSQVKTD